MNPRSETPVELVGDWHFACSSKPGADGYFTILSDCRYVSFVKDSEVGVPVKWCPGGFYPATYRLIFTGDQEMYFKSKTMKKGILHSYSFDGTILILERREPVGRWLCRKISSSDLPQVILAERAALMGAVWSF